ncbi:metalloregulator ArsR/SmtB family transcription factor [Planctomycetota bacterium]|nr:metalloregulator ArsR/SmtB family transcription factor [Planctomycetota bacterium]
MAETSNKSSIPSSPTPEVLMRQMATLSDETRLRLLRLLERQELGVAELCDILQMPQSTVSRHLKILSEDHWTVSRRAGTTNLYRMIPAELTDSAQELWKLAKEQTEGWATLQQDQIRLTERLRQRRAGVQSFFEGAAAEWGETRHKLYGSMFTHDAIQALIPAEYEIADLGCGIGDITARLARTVKHVYGIDNSPAMIEAAKQQTAAFSNVSILEGDLDGLPLEDGSVDAALVVLVLTYLPEIDGTLKEACRVLRAGGKLVILDLLQHDRDDFRRQLDQHHAGFGEAELISALEGAGFGGVVVTALPPEADATGPALVLASASKPV